MPLSVSFTAVKAKERQIDVDGLIAAAEAEANIAMDYVIKKLKTYPPPRPGSNYIRTYKLQRGWKKVIEGQHTSAAIRIRAVNRVRYVRRVQGPFEEQEAVHQGRWKPAEQIMNEIRPVFYSKLAKLRRKYNGVVGG